jgi:hypothetical protein
MNKKQVQKTKTKFNTTDHISYLEGQVRRYEKDVDYLGTSNGQLAEINGFLNERAKFAEKAHLGLLDYLNRNNDMNKSLERFLGSVEKYITK